MRKDLSLCSWPESVADAPETQLPSGRRQVAGQEDVPSSLGLSTERHLVNVCSDDSLSWDYFCGPFSRVQTRVF